MFENRPLCDYCHEKPADGYFVEYEDGVLAAHTACKECADERTKDEDS